MDKLNDILREAGVSKVKLSKYLGVSRQMIYNYLEMNDISKWPKDKKMKSTGMVRKIDELGRIVIPAEIRQNMDLKVKDTVEIFTAENRIILQKYQPSCIFCNNGDQFGFVHSLCPLS